MRVATSRLTRSAGLALMVAGVIFTVIQPVHPADVLGSVTTGAWSVITTAKLAMCALFLLGIAGLYARQANESGWLGLLGFLLLYLSWSLQTGFVFAEVFILPVLAAEAPSFVDSFLGIVNGSPGELDIGALPAVYNLLVGIPYMLGGLLFGVAIYRAGVLPRGAGLLLAVAATLTPAAALLPHAIQRYAAIPVAVAFIWMGYELWSERTARRRAAASLAPAAP